MPNRTIDCMVLSGGGAKGAYGAGAAKGILKFRQMKDIRHEICFVGTSAGALNAAVLSLLDAEQLQKFWFALSPSDVLGSLAKGPRVRLGGKLLSPIEWINAACRRFGIERRFSLYSSRHLMKLLEECLPEQAYGDRHLVITTTTYTSGKPCSFYVREEFHRCVAQDRQRGADDQRLKEFRRVNNMRQLHDALLASASIPAVFPPVKLDDGQWYVDGGLANNTPTRQAALYLRHLHDCDDEVVGGDVYCIMQNTPDTLVNDDHTFGLLEQVDRAYELLSFAQMEPVIDAWDQINRNIEKNKQRVDAFLGHLKDAEIDPAVRDALRGRFLERVLKISFRLLPVALTSG